MPGKDNEERYGGAKNAAWKKLAGCDAERLARGHKLQFDADKKEILVPFLGGIAAVDITDRRITAREGPRLTAKDEVLVLHFLLSPPGVEPVGELAAFREFEGGMGYEPAFQAGAPAILKRAFDGMEDRLIELAEKLGGKRVSHGDVAVEIPVFPRLPITVILYRGDEEVPGSANVVFDRSAGRILATEDLVVAAVTLALRLMFMLRGEK